MKIDINGKRNISLDFNAPRKFRLTKDGAEIPYIRTGKNSFRLSKNIDGVVDLEEIIEQPRYMQPVQLQPQQMTVINPQDVERLNEAVRQMSLVNPNDVMIINQTAEQLEKNQNFIAQTQKEITDNQVYIDQQQQRLNESALGIQALETNNSQRLDSAETSIYSLASDLDIVKNATIENTYALDSIREQELITQASLETKADKTDVEKIKEELEEYKDDNESFKNALSNYSGGLASDSPVTEGGKDGQILTKITNESGVYGWKDSGLDGKQDKLTQTQMDAVNSGANQSNIAQITTNQSDINTINGKIPSDASSSNQLADKAWVGNQGYITGITSGDVTTALGYTPYDASNPSGYTSNIGTVTSVNNVSPDGSGNVTLTLPDPLPSQTGQSGKFLSTDGTNPSWQNVDALPSQTGQSGKYLTTDGTNPSWNTITIPSVDVDVISINRNADDELQTIGVINQNDTTTALKVWSGDESDLPAVKDANTFYATEEELSVSLLDVLYPVGSIYITTNAACPLSTLIAGSTWVQETSRVLVEKKEPTDNDPTWYNLYSDGWCEQGGEIISNGDNQTISLLKAYTDKYYTLTMALRGDNNDGWSPSSAQIGEYISASASGHYSNSQFQFRGASSRISADWQASGYTSTTTGHKQFRRTA